MRDKIRILVGVDGSKAAERALQEAVSIAKRFSGSVEVVYVHDKGMENKAEEILKAANVFCTEECVECTKHPVLGSNPARALQDIAKSENFDLIVVGSRGLGSAASILLGSVSRQVITNSECNVLVVRK